MQKTRKNTVWNQDKIPKIHWNKRQTEILTQENCQKRGNQLNRGTLTTPVLCCLILNLDMTSMILLHNCIHSIFTWGHSRYIGVHMRKQKKHVTRALFCMLPTALRWKNLTWKWNSVRWNRERKRSSHTQFDQAKSLTKCKFIHGSPRYFPQLYMYCMKPGNCTQALMSNYIIWLLQSTYEFGSKKSFNPTAWYNAIENYVWHNLSNNMSLLSSRILMWC